MSAQLYAVMSPGDVSMSAQLYAVMSPGDVSMSAQLYAVMYAHLSDCAIPLFNLHLGLLLLL